MVEAACQPSETEAAQKAGASGGATLEKDAQHHQLGGRVGLKVMTCITGVPLYQHQPT